MKLCFQLDSSKHLQLTSAVEALKVMINMNPGTIDFRKASNKLAAEVAKFPETQVTKINVSYVGTGGQQGGNHRQGGAQLLQQEFMLMTVPSSPVTTNLA